MTRLCFLIAAMMLMIVSKSYGQDDSTRYINGLPVSEDDTVRQFPANDLEPKNHLRAVEPAKLPADLRDALEKHEQYRGWQDTTVYYDANTELYLVHVKDEDGVRIFGMNDKGKPVTFSQVGASRD